MTFSELKAEVIKVLGNLHSSHPLYGDVGDWVNRATNRVITLAIGKNKGALSMFPELRTSWTETTISGQNYLALPSDLLAMQSLYSFDSSSVPNLNTDSGRFVAYIPTSQFEVLQRATQTGYPTMYTRLANKVKVWPTPSADYTTYLHLYGLQREPEMSGSSDTPVTSDLWHDAFVNEAAHIGATKLGWADDAERLRQQVLNDIAMASAVGGLEEQERAGSIQLADSITRDEIYG